MASRGAHNSHRGQAPWVVQRAYVVLVLQGFCSMNEKKTHEKIESPTNLHCALWKHIFVVGDDLLDLTWKMIFTFQ